MQKTLYIIVLFLLTALTGFTFYYFLYNHVRSTELVYVHMNNKEQIMQLPPVDKPFQNNQYVENWMSGVILGSFNINFADYKYFLSRQIPNYTPQEWQYFINQLESKKFFKNMIQNYGDIQVSPYEPPILCNTGVSNGVYTWEFNFPLQIDNYKVNSIPKVINLVILVSRASVSQNTSGYIISYLKIKNGFNGVCTG